MTRGIYSIHIMWRPMHLCVLNWVLYYFRLISLATKHILADKGQNSCMYCFLLIIMTIEIANTCQSPKVISIYLFKDIVKYKYRLKRKDKNESREEIFYQMKVGVFFVKKRSVVGSVFCESARCP